MYLEAVVATPAELSCDLRTSVAGDYVLLVLWYKDGDTIPFYRYGRSELAFWAVCSPNLYFHFHFYFYFHRQCL